MWILVFEGLPRGWIIAKNVAIKPCFPSLLMLLRLSTFVPTLTFKKIDAPPIATLIAWADKASLPPTALAVPPKSQHHTYEVRIEELHMNILKPTFSGYEQ